ncbi:MAG: OmpA family protein [Sulfurovum sp.]|nr:MAG: OmpA family protein [Sulfurovum sp.]
MFTNIVKLSKEKFGLGEKSEAFVQNIVSQIIDKNSGGVANFISTLYKNGLGNEVKEWVSKDADELSPLKSKDVARVFGGTNGLIERISTNLELDKNIVNGAIGFALPKVISVMSPNGIIPSFVSGDIYDFIEHGLPKEKAKVSFITSMFGASSAKASQNSSPSDEESIPKTQKVEKETPKKESVQKVEKTPKPQAIETKSTNALKIASFVVGAVLLAVVFNSLVSSSDEEYIAELSIEPNNTAVMGTQIRAVETPQIEEINISLDENTTLSDANLTPNGTPITPRERKALEEQTVLTQKVVTNEVVETQKSQDKNLTQAPKQKENQEVEAKPTTTPTAVKSVSSKRVYFGSNDSTPENLNADDMNDIVVKLQSNPNAKVSLSGRYDKYGDVSYSESLSRQRASNIKQVLVDMGVNESQIVVSKPKLSEDSYNQARRVDINVME